MSFSSIEFIFIFLPVFLIVYYIIPAKLRMYCLLLGSLVFYWLSVPGRPAAVLLPISGIILAYISALVIASNPERGKAMTVISVGILFAVLLVFKYAGLFSGTSVVIPAGLSFYTFQLTGYIFDVYRKKAKVERSPLKLAAGMMMFPKLLSGPITPWRELEPQLKQPKFSFVRFDSGLRTLILGLGMKTLLADRIGGLWGQVTTIGFDGVSTPLAWLGILSYSLKLYFDFYGYSLMACGVGEMLGYDLPVNFRHPYVACSMSDFWRRWHITLGKWFTDYIYIPLGGNRMGKKRQLINLLVVWLCTGIWHGSTLNFLLWGLFLFGIIAVEKLLKIDRNRNPLSHLYMIPAILIMWAFFAVTDISQLGVFFSRLFPIFSKSAGLLPGDYILYGKQYGLMLIIGIVAATPLPGRVWGKIRTTPIGTAILFAVFWLAVYCMSSGLNDPFMYFNF